MHTLRTSGDDWYVMRIAYQCESWCQNISYRISESGRVNFTDTQCVFRNSRSHWYVMLRCVPVREKCQNVALRTSHSHWYAMYTLRMSRLHWYAMYTLRISRFHWYAMLRCVPVREKYQNDALRTSESD